MASIKRLKSGSWGVQVRGKGRYANETFVRYEDAKSWALDGERKIDRGETPNASKIARLQTFGDLVDLLWGLWMVNRNYLGHWPPLS